MAGFECSTFIWKQEGRRNYIELTGHDRHLQHDCEQLKEYGIGVVREALPWPFIDRGNGSYDWSYAERLSHELCDCGVTPIWDLFHYGLPDRCSPLDPDCLPRFLDYCREAAKFVQARHDPPHFFTPVNEISFFSAACTDMEWMYPFAKGRQPEMKRALCKMAIEGAKAIREIIPEARMVHVDPMIHTVPPEDRPDLADEAWQQAYEEAYEAFDILHGSRRPELGGSPEILDIVGVNVYHFSQAEMALGGGREILKPNDPRRKPLSEMLIYAWNRYRHPIIIGETSGYQDRRAEWLKMTMEESMKALNAGVDLQGVCLYPFVDIPDWNTMEWAKIGAFDIEDRETHERLPVDPYLKELRRWQHTLDAPEHFEPDGRRVDLHEVTRHAKEWSRAYAS